MPFASLLLLAACTFDQGSKAMKDMLQELGYMEGEGDL